MKKKVILKPLHHRGQECMAIYFDYDKVLQQKVKLGGATWSQSNKVWYMLLNRVNFEKIKGVFDGHASLDYSALKIYLEQKKNTGSNKSALQLPVRVKTTAVKVATGPIKKRRIIPQRIFML